METYITDNGLSADHGVEFCKACGEPIVGDRVRFMHGVVVHRSTECLEAWAHSMELRLEQVYDKLEKMVARGLS